MGIPARSAAILTIIVVHLVSPATAQAQSGFVQAAYALEIKRFSRETDTSAFDAMSEDVWFGGAGFIAPQWSLGIEVDLGGRSTVSDTTSVTISGRPAQITTSYTSRRRSVSALAGFHTPAGKPLQVGCYLGLSFTAFRREIASNAPSVVLQEPAPLAVIEERLTGAIVGIDAAIRAGAHLAIVPAFRAQGLSLSGELTGFSLRPSIGVRVVF